MEELTMRFAVPDSSAGPSNVVFRREDGHELSLSSFDRSLIHWEGSKVVKDYGSFVSADDLLSAVAEFRSGVIR